ncbi:MAG: encapsulin-associated ferritin-like protein [Acidimicrobiales bacterium]
MTDTAGLQEPENRLSPATADRHRAIASLQEELEAIDRYDQRVDATGDAALASVMAHNRDEEKEHAAMLLEWLRRHDAVLESDLRTYLFTSAPVTEIEAEVEAKVPGDSSAPGTPGTFGVGSLKGESL